MRKLQGKYTWAWRAWIAAFLVIEGLALWSGEPGDTLSEHVWNFQELAGSFGYAAVFALLGWLAFHFSPWEPGREE